MQNSCKCKKIYVTSSPTRNILLFHIYTFESNTNSRITSIFVKIIEASLFKKRGFRRLIKRYRLFSTRHDNSHRENLSRSNILRSRSLTRFQEQTFCLAYVHAKRERERERESVLLNSNGWPWNERKSFVPFSYPLDDCFERVIKIEEGGEKKKREEKRKEKKERREKKTKRECL